MVTIPLFGGMGNQCFQWAFGVGLAARGRKVQYFKDGLYDCVATNPHHRDKPEYGLDGFCIKDVAFGERRGPTIEVYDMPYRDLNNVPDECTVRGYFQCERYFAHCADEIRNQLRPNGMIDNYVLDLAERMANTPGSVAMHVRRGDYASVPGNPEYHGLMGVPYYKAALEYMLGQPGIDVVKPYIFSDDPQWCREHFDFEVVNTGNRFFDFFLISACRHAVIANSTFSWWAAWAGDTKDKPGRVVVAPQRWFATPTLDARDIVPARWVRI